MTPSTSPTQASRPLKPAKMSASERNRRKRLRKRPWMRKTDGRQSQVSDLPQVSIQKQEPVQEQEQEPAQEQEHNAQSSSESEPDEDDYFPKLKDFIRFTHNGKVCHGRVDTFVDPATDRFYLRNEEKNGATKNDPPFYNVKVGQKEWVSVNKSDFAPNSKSNVKICKAVRFLSTNDEVTISYVWQDRSRFVLTNQRMVDFADEGKKWVLV